jgi:hypothetical protein
MLSQPIALLLDITHFCEAGICDLFGKKVWDQAALKGMSHSEIYYLVPGD